MQGVHGWSLSATLLICGRNCGHDPTEHVKQVMQIGDDNGHD